MTEIFILRQKNSSNKKKKNLEITKKSQML